MPLDLNSLSFGQYLKAIRLKRGIELEVIAKETRVGMENLRHIESEAHDLLPAVAFVKGFLRAYAQALNVDREDVVRRYEESLREMQVHAQAEAELAQLNQRFWPRLLLSLITFTLLMALSITLVSISEKPLVRTEPGVSSIEAPIPPSEPGVEALPVGAPASGPVQTEPTADADTAPVAPEPVPPEASAPVSPATTLSAARPAETTMPASAPDRLRLKIVAHEETWLKINIDDREAEEYWLQPGVQLELQAAADFFLLVGNAGGIQLSLNDKPLPPLGRSGQVVKLRLP